MSSPDKLQYEPTPFVRFIAATWQRYPHNRKAEFIPLALLILAFGYSVVQWSGVKFDTDNRKSLLVYWLFHDSLELLTLATWTISLPLLQPISRRNVPIQQRYAVCCLLSAAAVLWFVLGSWQSLGVWWDTRNSVDTRWILVRSIPSRSGPDMLPMLLIPALVATAWYLRLGWGKESPATRSVDS
jgi:hypothetical protein